MTKPESFTYEYGAYLKKKGDKGQWRGRVVV